MGDYGFKLYLVLEDAVVSNVHKCRIPSQDSGESHSSLVLSCFCNTNYHLPGSSRSLCVCVCVCVCVVTQSFLEKVVEFCIFYDSSVKN